MPTPLDIIQAHLQYHRRLEAQTREQQLRHDDATISDYRGRIVVEFFQNAIDRAANHVRIDLVGNRFVVGNDNPAGVVSIFPLPETATDGRLDRSDFHSLCSSDTSRKRACESIGNKGLGFKSIFREAQSVEIWSRENGNGPWWGFRLRHPFGAEHAAAIAERPNQLWPTWTADWHEIERSLAGIAAPSFYFPEPLDPNCRPPEAADPLVTVIYGQLKSGHGLAAELERFKATPLHFVSARYPHKVGVEITVQGEARTIAFGNGWTAWPTRPIPRPELVQRAKDERLDFSVEKPPAVQLAFPPERVADTREFTPYFHCFFPTEVRSGFHTAVHADFVLDQGRKGLEFGKADYNGALLDVAAEQLLVAFESDLHKRTDAWLFLTPGDGAHHAFSERVAMLLFGPDCLQSSRWVRLVELTFAYHNAQKDADARFGAPWTFHEDFWALFAGWWRRIPVGEWRLLRERLIEPLRSAGIPVIPLVSLADAGLVGRHFATAPMGKASERTVLLRPPAKGTNQRDLTPPAVLAERVTITAAFPHAEFEWYGGLVLYRWDTLVEASRGWITGKLPGGQPRWSPDDPAYIATLQTALSRLATSDREELLRFWYAMALDADGAVASPGERLLLHAGDRILGEKLPENPATRLRAESSLPLPVVGGGWLPACRVSASSDPAIVGLAAESSGWGCIDRAELMRLGVESDSADALLCRLGCFTGIPLLSTALDRGYILPFNPTDVSQDGWNTAWSAIAAAFAVDAPCLGQATFAASVAIAPWLPVLGSVRAPADCWRVPEAERTKITLLPVRKEGGDEAILRALGVYRLPAQRAAATDPDVDPKAGDAKAFRSLMELATLPVAQNPRELRGLYARLVQLLGDTGAAPPVLVETPGSAPRWLSETSQETAVLASDESRHLLVHFSTLPRVVGEGSRLRAQRLGVRPFAPEVTVGHEGAEPTDDAEMRERLAALLPMLYAVTEVARPGRWVSVEDVGRAWENARICKGYNVYMTLVQPGTKPVEFGRGASGKPIPNQVFLRRDGRTAWHDIPRADLGADAWLPKFAGWFAIAVFNNSVWDRHFSAMLEHIGKDWSTGDRVHLARHLDLLGVEAERVEELTKQFNELFLTPEQRVAAKQAISTALSPFGRLQPTAELLAPFLGPEVFSALTDPDRTETEVNTALRELDCPIRPTFACRDEHLRRWEREKAGFRYENLASHLLTFPVAEWNEDLVVELHAKWDLAVPSTGDLSMLGFSPCQWARSAFPAGIEGSEGDLTNANLVVRKRPYAPLTTPPVTNRSRTGGDPGLSPVTDPVKRTANDANKGERGRSAELRRADEAALNVLHAPEGFRPRIDAERAALRSKLRNATADQLTPIVWADSTAETLAKALHIAGEVDCGYDVLDIDVATGDLLLVEVKSHNNPDDRELDVLLSGNELRRARQSQGRTGVRFRLEVYLGYGLHIDATDALFAAMSEPAALPLIERAQLLEVTEWRLGLVVGREPG